MSTRTDPSARVRLEIALLDDPAAPAPVPLAAPDERPRLTVLVVAAEADVRRYVGECLRERTDLCLLEAATVSDAVARVASHSPKLIVVDEPERDVLRALSELRAILIVDDVPHGSQASGERLRMLVRPFSAEGLVAEVGRLLGY